VVAKTPTSKVFLGPLIADGIKPEDLVNGSRSNARRSAAKS